jgi:histone acetyltransferase (RNA polymerase elongator complex component)
MLVALLHLIGDITLRAWLHVQMAAHLYVEHHCPHGAVVYCNLDVGLDSSGRRQELGVRGSMAKD